MAKSFSYRVIQVGVDFSVPSGLALERGLDLARQLGARLDVVHVVERLKPALPFSGRNRTTVARLQRELVEQARERLARFVPRDPQLKVRTIVVRGDASKALLRQAQRARADLIVLANRGHSPLEDLLIGSTTERLLRTATVPVLMVSAPSRA